MIRSVWQQKGQLIGQFLSKTHRRLPMADTRSAAKQAVQASFRNRIKSMKARGGTGAGLVSPQEGPATEVAIAPTAKSNDPLVRYHASTYRDSLNGQGTSKSPLDLPPADADEPNLRDEDLPFDLSAVNLINPQVEYHDDEDEPMTYPQAHAQADARLSSVVVTGTPVVEEPESIADDDDDESESSRERGGGGSHSHHSGSSARPTESSQAVSFFLLSFTRYTGRERCVFRRGGVLETDSLLSHNRDPTHQRRRPAALRSVLTNRHRAPPFPNGCASRVRPRRARRARPSRPVRRSGRRDCQLRHLHMATFLDTGLPTSATSKRHDSSSVVLSTRERHCIYSYNPVSTTGLDHVLLCFCELLTFHYHIFNAVSLRVRCVEGGCFRAATTTRRQKSAKVSTTTTTTRATSLANRGPTRARLESRALRTPSSHSLPSRPPLPSPRPPRLLHRVHSSSTRPRASLPPSSDPTHRA